MGIKSHEKSIVIQKDKGFSMAGSWLLLEGQCESLRRTCIQSRMLGLCLIDQFLIALTHVHS